MHLPTQLSNFHGAASEPIAAGDTGIRQTMHLIRQLVDVGVKTPVVNETAIAALNQGNATQFDDYSAARAVFDWVQRNIRYVPDPVNKETVRPADVILRVRAGDCDDINGVLIPSLLGTIGIGTRLVTVAVDPSQPDQFSHIYAEAFVRGQWVPLDSAREGATFGLAPEAVYRRELWPVNHTDANGGVGRLAGMAMGADWSRFGLRGLGDDPSIWSDIISAIGPATSGAASIIKAENPIPLPLYPGTVVSPTGQILSTGSVIGGTVAGQISGTTLLMFGGIGLLALFLLAGRR